MRLAFLRSLVVLLAAGFGFRARPATPSYFVPEHRLSGIGAGRAAMPPSVLQARTKHMIESQTFTILREPEALTGMQRVSSPRLQKLFKSAAAASGFPATTLTAICYLESFGNPNAESSAGPKGIMQFAESTARAAGLQIVHITRYRTTTARQQVRDKKGRLVTRNVRSKVPYTVLVRDDRLIPERAIPAAARYLAALTGRYGREDWAVFAYHCGEGCVGALQPMVEKIVPYGEEASVAAMFFAASPVLHRVLFDALRFHMERDYSPTYWFRVMRARELVVMYQNDPAEFRTLVADYRNGENPSRRADHRLVLWLRDSAPGYRTRADLRAASPHALARAPENPEVYGFTFQPDSLDDPEDRDLYAQAAPSTIGTILYIAYETRRLYEAVDPSGETFVPLVVAELVNTVDRESRREPGSGMPVHATGMVFDLATSNLPRAELECLNMVLDDMGWDGCLGFIPAGGGRIHIGCSPSSRDFFTQVYQDVPQRRTGP